MTSVAAGVGDAWIITFGGSGDAAVVAAIVTIAIAVGVTSRFGESSPRRTVSARMANRPNTRTDAPAAMTP